jgi:reticulon-4-interacting protein 1, mitochondrial
LVSLEAHNAHAGPTMPSLNLPILLQQSVTMNCEASKVWAFIRDMENYVQWFPFIVQMDSADTLPVGTIGKRYKETAIAPGGKEESINVEVVALDDQNFHLAIEADLKPVLPRFDYQVVDIGGGETRFDWRCSGRAKGAYAALGRKIMPLILRPRLNAALENLARILGGRDDEVMLAAHFLRFGSAQESTLFTDRAKRPSPQKGEVVVRMYASSINQIDLHRRKGYGRNAMRARGALKFPVVLGNDIAGVIEAVGAGVSTFKPGDPVFGVKPPSSEGAFAAFVATKAECLARLPDGIDYKTAAALPYTFLTAWSALVLDAGLSAQAAHTSRIFIQGGAGGVGSMAIQIAKNFGAYVAASCAPGQAELVKAQGADEVFEVGASDYSASLSDYDIAFCAANPAEQDQMIKILKHGGVYVSVVHPTLALTDELGLFKGFMTAKKQLRALNSALKPDNKRAVWTLFRSPPEAMSTMREWLETGRLKPIIDRTYPFEGLVAAQERSESGQATGKVVVEFQSMNSIEQRAQS